LKKIEKPPNLGLEETLASSGPAHPNIKIGRKGQFSNNSKQDELLNKSH
jgi:hypothetical protein